MGFSDLDQLSRDFTWYFFLYAICGYYYYLTPPQTALNTDPYILGFSFIVHTKVLLMLRKVV